MTQPPLPTHALPQARVIVFVDYMNVYEDFRRAFCSGTLLPTDGQFDPVAFGKLLAERGPNHEEWRLSEVRVYVGQPIHAHNTRAATAHDRQSAVWRNAGVVVLARPLQYLPGGVVRQKGIDVALAVDVVSLAHERKYEIAIIASTDTDLVPAIEAVQRFRGFERFPRVCVVSYDGLGKRLQLPDTRANQPYAFRMSKDDYAAVRDRTVYVDPKPPVP